MKQIYRNLGFTIGKYRCVSINKEDHTLAGEKGEIWVKGEGTFNAFRVLPGGDEKLFSFETKDLAKWVLRLKVPSNIDMQLYWANHPNERHD